MANDKIEYDVVVNGKKAVVSINGVEKAQVDLEKTVTKSNKRINVSWKQVGIAIAAVGAATGAVLKTSLDYERLTFSLTQRNKDLTTQMVKQLGITKEQAATFAVMGQSMGISEDAMGDLIKTAVGLGRAFPTQSTETLLENLIQLNKTGEAQGFLVDILESKFKTLDTAVIGSKNAMQFLVDKARETNAEFDKTEASKVDSKINSTKDAVQQISSVLAKMTFGSLSSADAFKQMRDILNGTIPVVDSYGNVVAKVEKNQSSLVTSTNNLADKVSEKNEEIAKSFEDVFADNITDTMMEFMENGKASFADFAKSIANDIARIIIQAQIARPIAQGIMGTGFGAGLTTAGGGTETAATGAVLNGGIKQRFAKGGVTTMPQMRGNTLIGEAGAEAVMPLTRTSNGDLGVKMIGSGGNNNHVINVDLTVNAIDSQSFQTALVNDKQTIKNVIIEAVNTDTNMKRTIKNV